MNVYDKGVDVYPLSDRADAYEICARYARTMGAGPRGY